MQLTQPSPQQSSASGPGGGVGIGSASIIVTLLIVAAVCQQRPGPLVDETSNCIDRRTPAAVRDVLRGDVARSADRAGRLLQEQTPVSGMPRTPFEHPIARVVMSQAGDASRNAAAAMASGIV